jgi:acetate kinase
MNNILVINSGSKTIKFEVFTPDLSSLLSGTVDDENGQYFLRLKEQEQDSEYANQQALNYDETPTHRIIAETAHLNISKVGFRIVHGGEKFTQPTELTDSALTEIAEHNDLAPLHNPPALALIKEFKQALAEVPMYAVFDTAFHQTLAPAQFLYGLPYEYYEKYGIRRFGFHGISHKYVSQVLATLEPQAKRVISCHLGSGSSVAAILNGFSFDTSMGFTPLEGLIMTTRPGDVDDGAITYLQKVTGLTDAEIQKIENTNSGLLGISGISFDMRNLLEAEQQGNTRAHLAIEMFVYRATRYIGSYIAAMGGVDALIFTAGIGAGSDAIRSRICKNLEFANLIVAENLNNGQINVEQNLKISNNNSKPIWVIPTDEELQIAREIC